MIGKDLARESENKKEIRFRENPISNSSLHWKLLEKCDTHNLQPDAKPHNATAGAIPSSVSEDDRNDCLSARTPSPDNKSLLAESASNNRKKIAIKAPPTPNKSPKKTPANTPGGNPKKVIMEQIFDLAKAGTFADMLVDKTGLDREQITNRLRPGRANLRSKVLAMIEEGKI